jgi:3-hydroxy acid dehydrogenase/malonic semialdehyde reductase
MNNIKTLKISLSLNRYYLCGQLSPINPRTRIASSLIRNIMSSAMGKRLEGKTIVITGASSGIGKSTAFEFARTAPKDLKLILAARRLDSLEQVKAEINKEFGAGVKIHTVKLDVSNAEDINGFVNGLPKEFQDIDVLVNNAYVYPILTGQNLTAAVV